MSTVNDIMSLIGWAACGYWGGYWGSALIDRVWHPREGRHPTQTKTGEN